MFYDLWLYLSAPFDDTDTCVVEGNEYKVGQKFWPSHTCLECVCQKGFIKGKFEAPFCQSRLCGEQLDRHGPSIQASCAPLYGKHESRGIVCCPKDWICREIFFCTYTEFIVTYVLF